MMNPKYLLIGLLASMIIGCGCAAALSFSGETVQLTGNQTGDIVWNESNFGGFCYDLSGDAYTGTETLTIGAGALEGPDIDRLIDAGNLMYTTTPIWQEYELHKNLGLTVEGDRYGGNSGYMIEFWMGERYVAVGGNASKLAKPLVEFNDTDTKSLAIGEEWDLGDGFTLTAMQIDLEGDKVWIRLCRNEKELDSKVIDTGSSDLQGRVCTYAEDVAGEMDVPIFSCYVSEVFRGTDSSMIQVKYVFLIDNDILQISAGEYYGNMQVRSITPNEVTLGNWDSLNIGQHPSTCPIMGNLSFKTVNNDSAIEFYPHLIRDELPVLSGGGGFISDHCGWCQWDLYENYTLGWNQVGLEGAKAWIVLCKDGVVVDEQILTEEQRAPVDSDCRYSYVRNGTEIINATLKVAFRGCAANAVKLVNVTQYSDADGTALIVDGSHLYKTGDPDGMAGELMDGYVLTVKDIDLQGDKMWLELSTNGIVLKEDILESDDLFEYRNDDGLESVDCTVEAVFRGCDANIVKLKNVTQYSGTGMRLIENESMIYPAGVNDHPMTGLWALEEGYSLSARDIDFNGNKVWLLLLKDGEVMKDAIIDSGRCDADRWFKYYNVTGALVFSTYVDVVFRGTKSNLVQLRYTTQYSEIDGGVFEWAKNIVPIGIVIIAPPTITGYNPDSYVSDPEGVTREFNIAIDQSSDVVWYIDGTVVKDTEKGVTSAYYTNDSAKTGYWNVSAVASNANGTDMRTWWWAVNLSGYPTTGYRIWEEGMGDPYRWTAQSFNGFYYDIDDGLSTETLTITGIDRSLDEGSIVYETRTRSVNFDYSRWGEYDVIGFAAEMYFAGYNSDTNSDITDDPISLISNKMLSKVLIDEDDKHMVSTGASLELEEGYEVKIIQLDIQGDTAQIELLRDGNIVDTGIISNTPSTYTYPRDIGSVDDVPIVVIRVDSVFAGTEGDVLVVKGIFQISENYKSIETGDTYGEMEIKSAGSSGITMKNNDTVSLGEGEIVDLMGNVKFRVADSSTLRFALYNEITEPGTHDIRGTVYNTAEKPTWTHMNFEGFYYDIDEDLGTEGLEVKNVGTCIDDGNLAYTTTVQSVRFDYSGWGVYNVIGFMAEKYFAGYNSGTDNDITDDPISLVSHKMLSKVLIDSDKKHTVSTGASLELEEGYELKIIQLDVSGAKAQIELIRDGNSVDTCLIANTPATYTYTRDLGSVDDVPVVVIRVGSVFAGTESDMLVINGVFQISENCKFVEAGDRYVEMEITHISSTGITMKNPDDIDLNEGGNAMIMDDIGFMTSDDGNRYALFVRRTIGPIAALKIELPESLIVGEESVITVTSYGTPVEGAHVRFAGGNLGPTDSNGEVRFTPDTAGMFMITAIKENYDFAYIAVWIVGGSAATADAVIALQLAVSGEWDADVDVSDDGKVTSLDALMILQASTGAGAEQHVYPGAGTPIQDAIDDAKPGDTIYVHAGEYCENVDVWKHVTLIGDGADVVTVRAADAEDHVFEVTTDWVNIRGFTATGATAHYIAGIYLDNADYCSISSNTVLDNFAGIYLYRSSNNTLANNTASDNSLYGIFVWHSSNNTITKNTVSSNKWDGIRMESSSNNTLTGNAMSGNRYNFGVSGGTHNIDTSNKVNEKPIYYWVNQQDKQIPRDAGYVGVVNSTNIIVRDLTLANNGPGILFAYTSNSKIENVTASNNCYGIELSSSSNNNLNNNTVSSNNWGGIRMHYSSDNNLTNNTVDSDNHDGICMSHSSSNNLNNNTVSLNGDYGILLLSSSSNDLINNTVSLNNERGICLSSSSNNNLNNNIVSGNGGSGIGIVGSSNILTNNIISYNERGIYLFSSRNNNLNNNTVSRNNERGIYLSFSSNNLICHNNIINNTHNAYDRNGTNQWDQGAEGNYYSDYTGTDNNTDGIGDDPHPIPGGISIDCFPLMQPWTGAASQKGDLNHGGVITPADTVIALQLAAGGDEEVNIGGWVLENKDSDRYAIPAGTIIEPHGYYLTTEIQLDNGGGYVLLYRDGGEVDSSIAYTHSTEGLSWQRRSDGLDTDSDGDWIERDPTFGVPT